MGNKKELECRSNFISSLPNISAEVNSHTKLFTHLCVLILFYLLACVKGNGKLLFVIKSVNSGRAHLEKHYYYQSKLLGRKRSTSTLVRWFTYIQIALQFNLIWFLLIGTLPCHAITLVCLHEFLHYFPSLGTHIHARYFLTLFLRKSAFLEESHFMNGPWPYYQYAPKNNHSTKPLS